MANKNPEVIDNSKSLPIQAIPKNRLKIIVPIVVIAVVVVVALVVFAVYHQTKSRVVKTYKLDGGTEQVKADGSTVIQLNNGEVYTIAKDGKYTINKYPKGSSSKQLPPPPTSVPANNAKPAASG